VPRKPGAERITQRAREFRELFNSPLGQKVIRHIARYCRADQTTFVAGDPYASAHAEGGRTVYLWITTQARIDPDRLEASLAEMED